MGRVAFDSFSVIAADRGSRKTIVNLLVLSLLCGKDYYVQELYDVITERNTSNYQVVRSSIYRTVEDLCDQKLIAVQGKLKAPDGRKRIYYGITPLGKEQFVAMRNAFLKPKDWITSMIRDTEVDC